MGHPTEEYASSLMLDLDSGKTRRKMVEINTWFEAIQQILGNAKICD
jgi:hypothetical protein